MRSPRSSTDTPVPPGNADESHERPGLRALAGYVPGTQPRGGIKLNTNENPWPPVDAVAEALRNFPVEELRRYPSPGADRFRETAARVHGVAPDQIIATNGGDELLRLALATYVEPGDPVGVAPPSYSLYQVLIQLHGARALELALDEDWDLPEDFAAALNRADAPLAFLVNPHAPSGRLFDRDTIAAIADEFRGVLLVDEAYVDFVDPAREHDLLPLLSEHPNLLLLRTLSKGYSLAGLRFGYGIGNAALLRPMATKTRDSYNVDAIAQTLACTALEHRDEASNTWMNVHTGRELVRDGLDALGLAAPPSETNFLLARVPPDAMDGGGAQALHRALAETHDIHVRWFDEPRLRDCLRISIGTPGQNDQLLDALAELLGGGE